MLRRRFNQNDNGEYMTLVASEGDTVFIVSHIGPVPNTLRLYYSINGDKWTKVNLAVEEGAHFSVAQGGNIRFKSTTFISEEDCSINFYGDKPFSVSGNILSLGYLDDAKGKTIIGNNRYAYLFANSKVRHVDANFLPATSLSVSCYENMFRNCTYLESAPTLPSVVMERYCYSNMFFGCTSLTTAPELPATTLDAYCYEEMFYRCSKLNYIKMLATDISARYCLHYWVKSVASTGTFVKNPEATWDVVGDNGVPNGWTVKFDGEEDGGGNLISFTIDGTQYQAEEGMTWEEWVNSEYNINMTFGIDEFEGNTITNGVKYVGTETDYVKPSDLIIANYEYLLTW